jgi:hypothetical protein
VTIHGVWIGNWIYWILRTQTTDNYNSLTSSHIFHILLCSVGTLCLLFLLGAASQWLLGFCVLLLLPSLVGIYLTTQLGVAWLQSSNKGHPSCPYGPRTAASRLYYCAADLLPRAEDLLRLGLSWITSTWLLTMGFSSPDIPLGQTPYKTLILLLLFVSTAAITWQLLSHCLRMGVYAEPFPSNGCLCQLHNSGFHHTCHSIFKILYHILCKWLFNHMKLLKDETIFIKLHVTLYWPFKTLSVWKYCAKVNCVENPLK